MDKTELLGKLSMEQFKTQSDYLADQIKLMITSEEFEDGFVFPNENEFCKMLNVSRGTLRDAYKKLATQGFIERTNVGTYVKCRDTIAMQGNYSASLELATTDEMVEFICSFEPEAASLAAKKIDDVGIAKLENLMQLCENAAGDYDALNAANYEFHKFIRIQSKNNLIISVLNAYYDVFDKQIINTIYLLLKENANNFKEQALIQHRQLVEAFRKRDGEKAKHIVYDHLQQDLKTYTALKHHR